MRDHGAEALDEIGIELGAGDRAQLDQCLVAGAPHLIGRSDVIAE